MFVQQNQLIYNALFAHEILNCVNYLLLDMRVVTRCFSFLKQTCNKAYHLGWIFQGVGILIPGQIGDLTES